MNILVIHETEYIKKVIYEFQIIPEIWASSGHKVYVIDFPAVWEKKGLFDFGSIFPEIIHDVHCANKKSGITLIRPGVIRIPGFRRLSAFISYWFLIPKVIKKQKIEKIFLYSIPTNGLQTLYWARKLRIPVYFRLLDVLHQLVPSKILSFPTYIIEKYVYKRVSQLTAITPRLTQYAIEMGADPFTTTFLPTGSDADQFFPQKKDANLLKQFGLKKNDKVLLFAGTLYNFSGLDVLIEYWGKNQKNKKNLKLLIVGHGEQTDKLKELIDRYHLNQNIILTGFINYLDLNKYLNLADICINPFEINDITDIIFPSKIYQYLACHKPVIATKLQGLLELFPVTQNSVSYFNLKRPKEFFDLAQKTNQGTIKNSELSLQQIASQIEKDLKKCR